MPENKPLSYLRWVQSIDSAVVSESDLFSEYNEYVSGWYRSSKNTAGTFAEYRKDLFISLLKEITLNYTTEEEKTFLTNVNLEDPTEVDTVLPFFVAKLKYITQYIVSKRHEIKFVRHRQYLKGSEQGVSKFVKDSVISLLTDQDFIEKYPVSVIPAVSSIVNNVYVNVEPLYDLYDHYFDTSLSATVAPEDTSLYKYYPSNTEEIDPTLWVDFDKAVQELLSEIPLIIQLNPNGTSTLAQSNEFELIGINIPRTDITQLPLSEFVNDAKLVENLKINYLKNVNEKYSGTKMFYLSTGNSITQYVSGTLFDPYHSSANYLNRYNSSHPIVPSHLHLHSEKDIGGFYSPNKEGLLNYERLQSIYTLDTTSLCANKVYIFPDPDVYGQGRGGSMIDNDKVLIHTDDNREIKIGKASTGSEGDITNDKSVHKFYPYQSREDSLKLHAAGISRYEDDVDFWKGDKKDIWANPDIYPLLPLHDTPVSNKQRDLLITDDILYKWRTDIYGNEYALFKTTHPTKLTTQQIAGDLDTAAIQVQNTDTVVSVVTGSFDYPEVEYFRHQLSDFTTEYENKTSSLSASVDVYTRQNLLSNRLFFRNVYSSEIGPASASLSAVFIKYKSDVLINSEIENNVRDIDIIDDIIILETDNYIIIEKYTYDLNTNVFTSILPLKTYVSVASTDRVYNKIGNHWYDDYNDKIYLTKTVLHPYLSGSNFKAIYPIIYVFDNKLNTFSEVFSINTLAPSVSSSADLTDNRETYNLLLSTGFTTGNPYHDVPLTETNYININRIDRPSVSVNSMENTMSVTFFGYDPGNFPYLYNMYFNTIDPVRLFVKRLDLFAPNKSGLFNHNIDHYDQVVMVTPQGDVKLNEFLEGDITRGGNEQKIISFEAIRSELPITGQSDIRPIIYGCTLSGRDTNPSHYKDNATGIVHMGAGLSATNSNEFGKNSTEVAGTDVLPYSHNASYLLLNSALTGVGNEIVVTFDVALYTNTDANSAYAQLAT